MTLVRVTFDEKATARAFDRAMTERKKEAHVFKPMDIKGMEAVCDTCYSSHN